MHRSLANDEEVNTIIRPNKRQIALYILKWFGSALLFGIVTFFIFVGIDFNPQVSLKERFTRPPPDLGPLTPWCFEHYIPEKSLNLHYGIIPSVPVIEDHTCYEYAALLKANSTPVKPALFHTYWSSKSGSFSKDQVASLRSFIATQPDTSRLYVWINLKDYSTLEKSALWKSISSDRIEVQVIEEQEQQLIQNTPLSTSWQLQHPTKQQKDLLRLVTLNYFGGVWFDLEVFFVRDMSPLLNQEWLSQGHCLETPFSSTSGSRFEGVFLHFFKQSPYLCEMMNEAHIQLSESGSLSKLSSLGPELYARVYHRLINHRMQTWAVLPWCFTDPSQCLSKNSLPSVFRNTKFDEKMLSSVFAFHWHTSWTSSPGSIYHYLVDQHRKLVSW